ncbi:MAG: hypothetical protein GX660_01550 [Clostridiaceae bacterium]|nr:hypothetical protein [Clostridiaceae bacterium]
MHELNFLQFAKQLSDEVSIGYSEFYKSKIINNNFTIEYADSIGDVKSEHKIDKFTKELIINYIKNNYTYIYENANVYMEDYINTNSNGSFNLYIDPVDGSRSADLNIGDPCFMITYSEKTKDVKFKDLKNCFIRGLKSNDIYFTFKNRAYYVPNGFLFDIKENAVNLIYNKNLTELRPIENNYRDLRLPNSSVIIRDGYGMRSVVAQKIDHSVLNNVKHCFSHDITGMELCYVASCRGIAHVMVEARNHTRGNKIVGSDGFNLIPYSLLKATNCNVTSLDGKSLDDCIYNPKYIYDFIACVNDNLLNEFIKYIKEHAS